MDISGGREGALRLTFSLEGEEGFKTQTDQSLNTHEHPGHGRLWPNRLWPNRLWPIFRPTLANRGLDRLWPNRLWPILVF